jgi:hypothetical protein
MAEERRSELIEDSGSIPDEIQKEEEEEEMEGEV